MNIKIDLSSAGIKKAIAEIKAYQQELNVKADKVAENLAKRGASVAEEIFSSATFEVFREVAPGEWETTFEENDVSVQVAKGEGANSWEIQAIGEDVAFIEFGAGVHAETVPHPNRPPFIAGLGELGQGKGQQEIWFFGDRTGTRGNHAYMPMEHAKEAIKASVDDEAKAVFSGDS